MANDADEMVMVPVPREHYPAVIQFLAHLMGGAAAKVEGPVQNLWTHDDVRRLMAEPLNPTVRAMLDLTCEAPDTQVTLAQIQRRARLEYPQARAQLAAFTKLLRKRFARTDWPVRDEQGPDGKLYY